MQARFEATGGEDPIFRTNDGSNSPNADVSTAEMRRTAYSMLLSKGLIRVGIGVPPDAEFELVDVSNAAVEAMAMFTSESAGPNRRSCAVAKTASPKFLARENETEVSGRVSG